MVMDPLSLFVPLAANTAADMENAITNARSTPISFFTCFILFSLLFFYYLLQTFKIYRFFLLRHVTYNGVNKINAIPPNVYHIVPGPPVSGSLGRQVLVKRTVLFFPTGVVPVTSAD